MKAELFSHFHLSLATPSADSFEQFPINDAAQLGVGRREQFGREWSQQFSLKPRVFNGQEEFVLYLRHRSLSHDLTRDNKIGAGHPEERNTGFPGFFSGAP